MALQSSKECIGDPAYQLHYGTQLSNFYGMPISVSIGFWHCHENGHIKTIQTIPQNICELSTKDREILFKEAGMLC